MKPESKGLAPAGSTTSLGFCTIEASASTEWSVAALLTHSTLWPALIVTFSGKNLGGVSLILIVVAGVAASAVPAPTSPIETTATNRIGAQARINDELIQKLRRMSTGNVRTVGMLAQLLNKRYHRALPA